jgi:hypothetical protein
MHMRYLKTPSRHSFRLAGFDILLFQPNGGCRWDRKASHLNVYDTTVLVSKAWES